MISITRVRVTGFSRRYLDVDWEIAPTRDDVQEWSFYVERSEAEAGPWDTIAGPLVDRYYVRDNTTPQITANRLLFYRVRAYNASRQIEVISGTADREGELDLIGSEIASLEALLFREYSGTIAWVFPVRTFGQRCPQCWDDVMAKRLDDSCPTCFGTGFSGGYHWPVETFLQFDKTPQLEVVNTLDHNEQQLQSCRCPASPRITPMSLIVDFKNQRFRVVSVAATSRLGVTVHQEVQMMQLQPGSIEDCVELKVPSRMLAQAARRNYSNPQCLESAGITPSDELDDLLGRYGYAPSP